jgi:hypothetical protein
MSFMIVIAKIIVIKDMSYAIHLIQLHSHVVMNVQNNYQPNHGCSHGLGILVLWS